MTRFNVWMRIIGGVHRGRKILGPGVDHPGRLRRGGRRVVVTRPITDRVKQSLFDRLTTMGALDGGAVLDLFAGTGSNGLEALSRGVEHGTFIEKDRSAQQRLVQNLQTLRLTDQAVVLGVDALATSWVPMLAHRFTVICCDPPYAVTEQEPTRTRLTQVLESLRQATTQEAVLVVRTRKQTDPLEPSGWSAAATYHYGSMSLHFYEIHPR